ncbi:hypothetical protein [Nocardia exalbida]|nr:hypothetical protein [Nocardia exalbida]
MPSARHVDRWLGMWPGVRACGNFAAVASRADRIIAVAAIMNS